MATASYACVWPTCTRTRAFKCACKHELASWTPHLEASPCLLASTPCAWPGGWGHCGVFAAHAGRLLPLCLVCASMCVCKHVLEGVYGYMRVCVCMRVCASMHVGVCMYACVRVCVGVRISYTVYVCLCKHLCGCRHARMCMGVCLRICVCAYMRVGVCMYACVWAYMCVMCVGEFVQAVQPCVWVYACVAYKFMVVRGHWAPRVTARCPLLLLPCALALSTSVLVHM